MHFPDILAIDNTTYSKVDTDNWQGNPVAGGTSDMDDLGSQHGQNWITCSSKGEIIIIFGRFQKNAWKY
jgi:hypothetical protein